MAPNGKFKYKKDKRSGRISIVDIETHRELFMDNEEDVKLIVSLMNDGYLIIKDKWNI